MKKIFIKVAIITIVFIYLFGLWKAPVSLALMNSESYVNWFDSLNFGGEETSSSTNYQLQDTLGEIGTGLISGSLYGAAIGFRQVESDPKFTFTISKNSINFGALTVGTVFQDSYTITTTTNALNGYQTTIVEDGNLRTGGGGEINDVIDGEVTAGSEEYGIRTSGANGQMNSSDTAITGTAQAVADCGSWVTGDAVTVTHKVSITPTTEAGYYSHTVTLISTGRF